MGCIRSIDPTFLTISLPGRINGKVAVTAITQSYLNIVSQYVNDEGNKDSTEDNNDNQTDKKETDYLPLDQLFSVGQVVCVKVLKVEVDKASRINVDLTMQPQEIHSDYQHNAVKKNMVLFVGIAEREEHGFVIETGIKKLRAFLPDKNLNAEDRDSVLVGGVQFCRVENIKISKAASTAQFSLAKDVKTRTVEHGNDINVNYILPGTITKFRVTKILKNGLQGNIFDDALNGYINEHQLGCDETKAQRFIHPKNFNINDVLTARVLYVMPLTKLVYLSLNLQRKFAACHQEDSKKILPLGTIIEDARVSHIGTGGIILKLKGGKYKGIVSLRSIRLDMKSNFDNDVILDKYAKDSVHKVRVIYYDPIDLLHICSVDKKVINEKYFTSDDLNVGEIVTAVIKRKIQDGRHEVTIGALTGYIHPLYLAPTTPANKLEPGNKIRCRVVCKSSKKQEIYLTNHKELMADDAPILTSVENMKLHGTYLGCVRKCLPDGWLIEFFNYIRGMVFRKKLAPSEEQVADRLYVGQIAKFTIKYITKSAKEGMHMILGLGDFHVEVGQTLKGKITTIQPNGLDVAFDDKNVNGFVPIMYLSDFPSLVHALHTTYHCNDDVEAIGVSDNAYSIRDAKKPVIGESNKIKTLQKVNVGDVIPAFIKDVNDEIIEVSCLLKNFNKPIKIHLKMFVENYSSESNINLVPDQKIFVKILSKNVNEKTLTCSAKLHDVWQTNGLQVTAKILQRYFDDIDQIKQNLVVDKNPLLNYKIGDVVEGEISSEPNDEIPESVRASTILLLPGNVKGILTTANDDIKTKKKTERTPGIKHKILVIWIDYVNQVVYGTTKSRYFERLTNQYDEDNAPAQLSGRQGLKADVLLMLEDIVVLFPRKVTKKFIFVPTRLHYNDFQPVLANGISEGSLVNVTTIDSEGEYFIGLFDNLFRIYENFNRSLPVKGQSNAISDMQAEGISNKRRKVDSRETGNEVSAPIRDDNNKKVKRKAPKKSQNETSPGFSLKLTQLDGAVDIDSDDSDYHSATEKQKKNKKKQKKGKQGVLHTNNKKFEKKSQSKINTTKCEPETAQPTPKKIDTHSHLPGVSNFWSTDLSVLESKQEESTSGDDSSDEDVEPATKRKKLTPQERFQAARAEEERIREIERRNADKNTPLTTMDQFERSVLSEPHSSLAWINYMVFHVEATELDRARAIARRALHTINYRETQERLNIWIALLNLEIRYGNKEAFNEVLKEALLVNEPFKVYSACLHIFVDCKLVQELCDMILTFTKKFRQMPECWLNAAQAYFEVDLPDKAKLLLNRSLASLPERDRKYIIYNIEIQSS